MSYTEEDIKGMSDVDINWLVFHAVGGKYCPHAEDPHYCSTWDQAGPLMVEYGIGLDPPDKELKDSKYWWANHGIIPKMSRHERQDWDIQVGDKNPLRAICEVILMINLKEVE